MKKTLLIVLPLFFLIFWGCEKQKTKPKTTNKYYTNFVIREKFEIGEIDEKNIEKEIDQIKIDSVKYNEYKIIHKHNSYDHYNEIIVLKGNRIIKKFSSYDLNEYTSFKLESIKGQQTKELVIFSSSAGNRGDDNLWVIELLPDFKIIFELEGPNFSFIDLNNDNILEVQFLERMYIGHLSNAFQPGVYSVYKYNFDSNTYNLSNQEFQDYYINSLEENKNNVIRLKEEYKFSSKTIDYFQRQEFDSEIISIVFQYIFSGKENVGWEFFENNYVLDHKLEIKAEIMEQLKNNMNYQKLYPEK